MLALLPSLFHYGSLPLLFWSTPSSWGTSLNLLFFYLTWATLLLSHPPLYIEMLGTMAVRVLTFVVPALLMAFLDFLLPGMCDAMRFRPGRRVVRKVKKRELERRERELERELERIRGTGRTEGSGGSRSRVRRRRRDELAEGVEKVGEMVDDAVDNLRDAAVEVRERIDRKVRGKKRSKGLGWRVYCWSVFNAVVLPAAVLAAAEFAVERAGGKRLLRVQRTLPLPAEIAWDIIRCIGLRELMSYSVHRWLLHSEDRIWPTAQHLSWNHVPSRPRSILACYDHPLNHALHQTLPALLPAFFVRMHLLTFFLWLGWTGMEQVVSYCGYRAAGIVPLLGGTAARVDCHYDIVGKRGRRDVQGKCFSVWGVTDWVCGTGEELVEESEGGTSSDEEEGMPGRFDEGYKR